MPFFNFANRPGHTHCGSAGKASGVFYGAIEKQINQSNPIPYALNCELRINFSALMLRARNI